MVKACLYGMVLACLLWGGTGCLMAAPPGPPAALPSGLSSGLAADPAAGEWIPGQALMLLISDGQGRVLRRLPLCRRGCFGIRYIHSVALSPVEDWFYARAGTIFLDRTIYQDFGAGLPHSLEPGQQMQVRGGLVSISGFDRPLPELVLRVGRVARHRLVLPRCSHPDAGPPLRGHVEELALSSLARPGSAVVMSLGNSGFRYRP